MKKFFAPVFVLILIAVAAYVVVDPGADEGAETNVTADPVPVLADKNTAQRDSGSESANLDVESDSTDEERGGDIPTEEDYYEIAQWSASIGFPQGATEYEAYDFDTVLKLAEQGDIYALHLLGKKMLKFDNTEDAKRYFVDCAARGSVACILDLASIQQAELFPANTQQYQQNQDEQRKHAIEMLAWYETAKRRGFVPIVMQKKMIEKAYQIELSEDEAARVMQRSDEQYNMLSDMRRSLGYDTFDNTPPEAVLKFGLPKNLKNVFQKDKS